MTLLIGRSQRKKILTCGARAESGQPLDSGPQQLLGQVTKTILLDLTDAELHARALLNWANYIETGRVTLSAEDVAQQNRHRAPKDQLKARELDSGQVALVQRLRVLAEDQLRISNRPPGMRAG